MVQLLTGHGSFASFLYRIERWDTDVCPHCEGGRTDNAEHTLQECPDWTPEREELTKIVGSDLSLSNIITKISESRNNWEAFSKFAEGVMSQKEKYERDLERGVLGRTTLPMEGRSNPSSPVDAIGSSGDI